MRGKKPPSPKKEEKSGRSSPVKAVDTLTPTTSSASINKLTAKRQANDLIAKANPKPPSKSTTAASKKPKLTSSKSDNKVYKPNTAPTCKTGNEKEIKAKKGYVVVKKKVLALKKNVSKKAKEQLKSQKISNELKNLGVNLLDHSFCSESSSSDSRQSFDVKASICEMVKTKSRTSVGQSTTTVAKPVSKKIVKKDEDKKEEAKPKVDAGKAKPIDPVDKTKKESEDTKATKTPIAKKPIKKPDVAKSQEKTEKPQKSPTNEPSEEKPKTKEEPEKKEEVKKSTPAKKPKVVKEKSQNTSKKEATAPIEQITKNLDDENDKLKPQTSDDINVETAKKEQIEEQAQKKCVKKKTTPNNGKEDKSKEELNDSKTDEPTCAETTTKKVIKPKKAVSIDGPPKTKPPKVATKAEEAPKVEEATKEPVPKKTYKKKAKEVKLDAINNPVEETTKSDDKNDGNPVAIGDKDPLELAAEKPVLEILPEGTTCKLIPSVATVEKVVKKPKVKNLKQADEQKADMTESVTKVGEKKAVKKKKVKNDDKEPKVKKPKQSQVKTTTEPTDVIQKTEELPSTSVVETGPRPDETREPPNQEAKSNETEVPKPIAGEEKAKKKKKVVKELTPEEAYQKKQQLLEKRRIRAAAKREELRKIKALALSSLAGTTGAAADNRATPVLQPAENQKIFVKSIESLQDPLKIPEPVPAPVVFTMEPSPPATIELVSFKPEDEEKDSEKEDSRPLSTFTSTTIKTEAASTTALPEIIESIGNPESPKIKRKYIKKVTGSTELRNLEPGAKKSLVEATKKEDIYEFHDSGSDALSPMPITKKPTFKPTKKLAGDKVETDDEDQASDTEITEKKPKSTKTPKIVKKTETPKYLKNIKEKESLKNKLEEQKEESDTDQSSESDSDSTDSDDSSKTIKTRLFEKRASAKNRKILLYGFWKGPKRHRVASLNAIAKVHCLYENESRVALEQSLIKAAKIASLRDAAKLQQGGSSSDEDEDGNDISVTKRSLRTAPGLRGVGKLWEFDDSSLSSAEETISDSEVKMKNKLLKDKLQGSKKNKKSSSAKKIGISKASKASHSLAKAKVSLKKAKMKKLKKIVKRSESDKSKDERGSSDSEDSDCRKSHSKKRKHTSSDIPSDFKDVGVRKRMASLNASAMLAASYEVERHCGSSYDSDSSVEVPQAPKKVKEVKHEVEEVRPVSTNLVIVQDTDVTITGMYVNSSAGSSQESYCKMQYRVQSSVTEERVVRASSQEAPKSYTPLTALSSMRPPGSQESSLSASSSQYSQPSQCESSADNAPMAFPPPPPMPPSSQPPYPPPPHLVASSTSAFCAPPPTPHHHDPTGYYQPAGPLISSHLLPPQQQAPPPTKPLDAESHQLLQQPPQSTSTADSTDSDVLITGGDLTPRPQTFHYGPQTPGLYARPPVHQMHCPTYPPNYYSPYAQHPQEMCYPQPYQPFYPQKVYPNAQPYRRYMPGPYYTHQGPPPPSEMYEQPPPSSAPPPPSQSQLVPAGPSGPQHPMDHYPYYGYSPGPGGQCYSRPPYMDAPSYQNTCPCPMQSCPKNVHTGPLIGSNKTSKGPVTTNSNHIVASPHEPAVVTTQTVTSVPPSSTANTVGHHQQQLATKKVLCKQENGVKVSGDLPATIKIKGENGVASPLVVSKPHQHHMGGHLYPYHHGAVPLMRPAPIPPHKEGTTYEKIALAPLPNYALNSNMNEPEQSISPARGSTGLSLPPVPTEATQPVIDTGSLSAKRPRIGKSMERERQMMMIHSQAPATDSRPSSPLSPTHQPSYEPRLNSSLSQKCSDNTHPNRTDLSIVKQEIKEEVDHPTIKTETLSDCESKEDFVVKRVDPPPKASAPTAVATPTTTPTKTKFSIDALIEPTPTPRRQLLLPKYDDDVCEVINLDESSSPLPEAPSLKRRKLLANMNTVKQPKKSPPNSYKNLIKRPESRNAQCIYIDADDDVVETELTSVASPESEPAVALKKFKALKKKKKKRKKNAVLKLKPRLVGISKKAKKNNKKLRKVAEKEIKEHRDREEKLAKLKKLEMQEPVDVKPVIVDISVEKTDESTTPPPSMAQQIFRTNIENTIDMVARGYFSEPELAAGSGAGGSMQPRVLKKLKTQEKPRSKSLTKKEKPAQLVDETGNGETDTAKVVVATAPPKEQQAQKSKRSKSKSKEEEEEEETEETHNLVNINNNTIKAVADAEEARLAKKAKATKTKKKSKDVEKAVESTVVEEDQSNNNNEVTAEEKIVQTIGAHIAQLATAMAESKQTCTESDEAEQRPTKVPAARKRSKSRSSKFSSRKRHRASMTAEVDPPAVVPRKSHSAPRWSNGWSWEGQSFQGKVFLNSDDLPVMRTCYPAMRHASGDIIRPRDSVLLRAGGKKGQELPYVAKVAYLWENPEDGEMMMSLLWYYRPEHTEQGRQPNDDVCEVFASRHKDHNSVACIEDKCFVLTYNEYCRYRRRLRMLEEHMFETPSIVPPLNNRDYSRPQVPAQTPTDLVMYCRRVYEFRLKRLMKQPN